MVSKTELMLNLLQAWEGRGEVGGNNKGWFVSYLTKGRNGSWCAALLYTALETICFARGEPAPFSRTHGAKRFTRRVAAKGTEVSWQAVQEGDIVCWNRGRFAWQGHVGIVVEVLEPGVVVMLDGNVGKRAKVRKYTVDLSAKIPWKCARLWPDDICVTP